MTTTATKLETEDSTTRPVLLLTYYSDPPKSPRKGHLTQSIPKQSETGYRSQKQRHHFQQVWALYTDPATVPPLAAPEAASSLTKYQQVCSSRTVLYQDCAGTKNMTPSG